MQAHAAADVAGADVAGRAIEIVASVLGVSAQQRAVLGDKTFAELGGSSLSAMRVAAQLRRQLGLGVRAGRLLGEEPLAGLIAALPRLDADPDPVSDGTEVNDRVCSLGQRRLWLVHQLLRDDPAYNLACVLRLPDPVDEVALRRAIDAVAGRHEALRTAFVWRDDHLEPVPVPGRAWDLERLEVNGNDAERLNAALLQHARRPFDLGQGPLLRVALMRHRSQALLLVVVHHIAVDGWSLGLVCEEVATGYTALRSGHVAPVTEPAPQYGEFVRWQLCLRRSGLLDEQAEWWREHLRGLPTVLELPIDEPRPSLQSFAGERLPFRLSAPASRVISDGAARLGVTCNSVLLAAYALCLSRYAGQRELLIGVPIAGRTKAEHERIVGFCANTLPVVVRIDPGTSFGDLARQVHREFATTLDHQDIPFDELVERLGLPSDPARNPLMQVFFAPFDELNSKELAGGLRLGDIGVGASPFDLTMFVEQRDPQIAGSVEYATALLRRVQVERFIERYCDVLLTGLAHPDRQLRRIGGVTGAERHYQLHALNPAPEPYPPSPVSRLFEEQAVRAPQDAAAVFGATTLTYAELDELANRKASALAAAGAGPGDLVAVCTDRSVETIAGLLGVLKLGAAYVAIEPNTPAVRRQQIIDRARPAAVLTEQRLAGAFTGLPVLIAGSEPTSSAPASAPAPAPASVPAPAGAPASAAAGAATAVGAVAERADLDDLAYVAFTSGSTGEPKGVCVPHRGVVRLVYGARYAGLRRGCRVLQFAPIAFDASTLEIWGPLLTGGTLVIHPPGLPSATDLGHFIRSNRITVAWLTSSWFQLMVDEAIDGFEGVECVLTGGDVVSARHVRRLLEHYPGIRVVNGYGPTESTTFATTYEITDPRAVGSTLPIGAPIPNTRAYVLDEDLRLIPTGAVGELCVGGDGLAAGYLGRPEQTVARFAGRGADVAERIYRTGDLVRYRADGMLQFIGRRDDQVKIRGHRVELEEVRQALYRHPALSDAAVFVHGRDSVERELVAAVVPSHGGRPGAAELRAFLEEQLPSAMVPSRWLRVESIPMTRNGKVDRAALQAELDRADAVAEGPAEIDENLDGAEAAIHAAWAGVLKHRRFTRWDNFFDVGGNSLRAAQVIGRLRALAGIDVPLRVVFETPTIAGLARRIGNMAEQQPGDAR